MTPFDRWFEDTFFRTVPAQYAAFLAANPNGLSGEGGSLYRADDVIGCSEERELHKKGVCFIGTRALEVFLLRAADGRIFIVDKTDYSVVDAWFSDIDSLLHLLGFDLPT